MSDWTQPDIKERSIAATEYRGYANIPVGNDVFEFPYKLLEAETQSEIQGQMKMGAVAEKMGDRDVSDEVEAAEETIEVLQEKDELTDAEEEQMQSAQQTLMQNQGELVDAIGAETLKAFHRAGREAIAPDSEDVQYVLDNPVEARSRFTDIDGAPSMSGDFTRERAERALQAEMREILDESPLLIYYTLGQTVWEESQEAGNVVESSASGQ